MLIMYVISKSWRLFKCPGLWDKVDLDHILGKGDQLFKSIILMPWDGRLFTRVLDRKLLLNMKLLVNKMG